MQSTRKRLLASYARRVGVLSENQTIGFTVLTGVILGVLVTISSVGAGALGVTALILLYPELPVVKIAGSDIERELRAFASATCIAS